MASNTYTATLFAQQVGVSKTSINYYISILEEQGYQVARNTRQHRLFSDKDIDIMKALVSLNKNRGMRLKEAAQLVLAPDFNVHVLPSVPEISSQVIDETKYEDLTRSMELLATHVYGIEQQNKQLLELIQAQRTQNDLLMEQNNTLKQELGSMMNHLLEKANEQPTLSTRQLDRVEQQNSAIMSVLNRMQNQDVAPQLTPEPIQQHQTKGLLAKLMKK